MRGVHEQIKTKYLYLLGICIIIFLSFLFSTSSRGKLLTNQTFDVLRTTSSRNDVVIIGIDDKSLQALGAWPWNREVFSRLTDRISSYDAKVLVYDVLFLEPREGDNAFKISLSTSQIPVILASKIDNQNHLSSFLVNTSTSTHSAFANVSPDSDGKVRFYTLSQILHGSCLYSLSDIAFNIATFKNNAKNDPRCDTALGMFRYPEKITTYPLIDVLNGEIPRDAFTNKTIFVGATALDLLDNFVGMDGEKIPGVYVHASQLISRLNNVNDTPLTSGSTVAWFSIIGLCVGVLFSRMKTLKGQLITLITFVIATTVLSVMLFDSGVITPWLVTVFMMLLIAGFVTLLHTMEERKKNAYIESIFAKYVHKDVLKELMKSSAKIRLDGEKKDMTILFSDLRGFTTLSENLEPEELTTLLNGYFSAMTPCILEEKGTIDKFIGDAIMAFWNAPLPVKDHPLHAVKSALLMEKALAKFNKTHHATLAIGIGIHRGEVIVGNVGSLERVNYTVLGDAVNLASRIEGLTKKYGVTCLITEDVKKDIQDESIMFRKLDVITVKGKSEPTILYEVSFKDSNLEEIYTKYGEAFALYEKRDFDAAEELFTALSLRGDKPSATMLKRIPVLQTMEGFDGVWHFDEK